MKNMYGKSNEYNQKTLTAMNRDSTLKLAGKHGRVPSASSRNYENTRPIVNPMEVVNNEYGSIANMPIMKTNYMLTSKINT